MPEVAHILQDQERKQRKAKAILVAAVLAEGGHLKNRTNLYKIFWTSHLQHMAVHGTRLSGWSIVRLPQGPGPNDGKELLDGLESEGIMKQIEVIRGGRVAFDSKISDEQKAKDLVARELDADEIASIEAMAAFLRNTSATQASNWSHEVSRAWREMRNGQELDIYLDLLSDDEEFAALQKALGDGQQLVDRIFDES